MRIDRRAVVLGVAVGTVAVALAPASARADTFVLKDGTSVEGDLAGLSGGLYRVKRPDGSVVEVDPRAVFTIRPSRPVGIEETFRKVRGEVLDAREPADPAYMEEILKALSEIRLDPTVQPEELQEVARVFEEIAEKYRAFGRWDTAMACWYRAVEFDPTRHEEFRKRGVEATIARAEAALAVPVPDYVIALQALRKAVQWAPDRAVDLCPRIVELEVKRGQAAVAAGRYGEARDAFRSALASDSANAQALEGLEEARFREALAMAREKNPDGTRGEAQLKRQVEAWNAYIAEGQDERYLKEARAQVAFLASELDRLWTAGADDLASRYFPMQGGAWWRYEGNGFQDQVAILDVTRLGEGRISAAMSLASRHWIAGAGGQRVEAEDPVRNYRVERTPDAVMIGGGDRAIVELRLPIAVGRSWDEDHGIEVDEFAYISDSETVATPAGIFEACLAVKWVKRVNGVEGVAPLVIYRYYAPGVGLVKVDVVKTDGDGRDVSEDQDFMLVAYDLPRKPR